MTFASLNPFGPIFTKELRVASRRRRTYIFRAIYIAGLLLFLMMTYKQVTEFATPGAVARSQQLAELGAIFFIYLSIFTLIVMMLIGPVMTCTAIGGERLGKTLPVLLTTPIGAWQIVSGKITSAMLGAVSLILLSLPAVALVRLLGGVEIQDMFGSLAMCAAVAFFGASVGLVVSTYLNRASAAILVGYFTLIAAYGVLPMIFALLGRGNPIISRIGDVLLQVYPFYVIAERLNPGWRGTLGQWHWPILAHVSVGMLLVAWSAAGLRRTSRKLDDRRSPERATKDRVLRELVMAGVYENPVLWREVRRPLMNKRSHAIVALIAIVGLALFIYYQMHSNGDLYRPNSQISFVVILNVIAILMACVLSGTVIAQEREGDTWTLLMATPVSARQVIWGKVLGILRRMTWPIAIVAAHFCLFAMMGVISWLTVFVILWTMVLFNAPYIATGVYLSLRCRKVTSAVMLNLAIPIALFVVLPIIMSCTFNRDRDWAWIYLASPFSFGTVAADELTQRGMNGMMNLPGVDDVTGREMVRMAIGIGTGCLVVAATVLWWTYAKFDGIVGRARGK
jgi:ABC-type transport system involved in multi-copper enzyme maturation permease subunit